jgi:hypothetical protein
VLPLASLTKALLSVPPPSKSSSCFSPNVNALFPFPTFQQAVRSGDEALLHSVLDSISKVLQPLLLQLQLQPCPKGHVLPASCCANRCAHCWARFCAHCCMCQCPLSVFLVLHCLCLCVCVC